MLLLFCLSALILPREKSKVIKICVMKITATAEAKLGAQIMRVLLFVYHSLARTQFSCTVTSPVSFLQRFISTLLAVCGKPG